ncbi:hypothetical protein ES703_103588 [subsurface metagenome]
MIQVYLLPTYLEDNTEHVAGETIIHDALLDTTEDPNLRQLIMNTTEDEHNQLLSVAIDWQEATAEEIERYNAQVIIVTPDPDTIRAEEILSTSPDAITGPETWELLRIIGRRLGYRF